MEKENFILRYRFQIIIGGIFLTGLVFICAYIIHNDLLSNKFFGELKDKDSPLYLRNVIIGIAALATAIFTWWKNVLNAKQVETTKEQTKNTQVQLDQIQKQILIQEESRLDSLFAKAVDFLKEENDLITRIGGVHTLNDLAISSPKHTQKCIDMLCSLNEAWMPSMLEHNPQFFETKNNWINERISNELLAKYSVFITQTQTNLLDSSPIKLIERISISQSVIKSISFIVQYINEKIPNEKFDLSYKYLCSIDLSGKNLSNFKMVNTILIGANLSETNIQESNLSKANLENANLVRANLQKTLLYSVNLKSTILYGANFQEAILNFSILNGAKLDSVNFQGASLFGASFLFCQLIKTNFQGANLFYGDLRGANLKEAILCGANLTDANFQGAFLMNMKFDYAVLLNTLLFGSVMNFENKQTVFYKRDFLSKGLDFKDKTEEEFKKVIDLNIDEKLKLEHKDEYNTYINRMLTAYSKQNKTKEINYNEKFNIIDELDLDFIQKRNTLAIQNKSVAKCMLTHEYSLIRDSKSPLDNLTMELAKFIKINKPNWYEEFKVEEII